MVTLHMAAGVGATVVGCAHAGAGPWGGGDQDQGAQDVQGVAQVIAWTEGGGQVWGRQHHPWLWANVAPVFARSKPVQGPVDESRGGEG